MFYIIEHLFALIVLYILAHGFDFFEEIIEGLSKSVLGGLILEFKKLKEFEVDAFALLFGLGHGWEVEFFVGVVEFDQVLLHLVLVDLPGVVNIHLFSV